MTIEKQFPSGAWVVSEIRDGYLVKRRYFGYSKAQAKREFRREFPNQKD